MSSFALLILFLVVSLQHTLSAAYSWQFTAPPTQCSNLAISIVGSGGQPPYHVLIIPSGSTPLANGIDPRPVIDQPFDGDSTSISFAINYPANSHFVAVVSDSSGFGTGGTSVETVVANSGDSSCVSPTTWSPPFYFGISKNNQFTQCQSAFVWWEASKSQGTVSLVGVIPGGQSFMLPESSLSTDPSLGTGFMWTADILAGTTLLMAAGDNRGMGSGGSAPVPVQLSSDATCLNSGSPSSTPGTPAGSVPTSTTTSTSVTSTSSAPVTSASSTTVTSTSSTSGTSTTGPNTSNVAGANTGNATGTNTGNAAGASTSNPAGTSANDTTSNGSGGPNVGVIVAGTVGGIIGLFIVIALVVICLSYFGRSRRDTSPLLPTMGQVNSIATTPEDALAHYRPEPFTFPEAGPAGAYNHGYAYSGQGYVEGMPPGATAVVPPPVIPRNSATSGSGPRISDISSPIRDSWYGQPPPQEDSYGLPQTSALASVRSEGGSAGGTSGGGSGDYDMSSQSSRHLIPSSSSSQGISPEQLQTGGLANVKSGGGGIAYRTSIQKGSRHLAPSPPSPTQGASSGLPQTSGMANVMSGGGVVYDTSSQSGSRHRVPSVTSSTSGPANMRGSPIQNPFVSPEEPPPAFSSLNVGENRPTGDVKYNITNAE